MKIIENVVCPVSNVKIDANLGRFSVFFNVVLMLSWIATRNPIFLGIVILDYAIRSIDKIEYSPTKILAKFLNRFIKIPPKITDIAPKIFSYRLGLFASTMALIFHITGLSFPSLMASSVLVSLMALDSFFGICVGCYIYSFLVLPYYKQKSKFGFEKAK